MTDFTQLKQELAEFHLAAEGSIAWMYLDDAGHLTVGIGHLLHKHSWPNAGNSRTPALADAIAALWNLKSSANGATLNPVTQLRTSAPMALSYAGACPVHMGPTGTKAFKPFVSNVTDLVARIDSTGALRPTHRGEANVPGVWGDDLPIAADDSANNAKAMTAEAAQIKTLPYGNKFGSNMFSCYNSFRMTREAILALHMVDLDDKITFVTHYYPAFANYPLPAQKAVLDLSYQGVTGWASGDFKTAVLASDWLAASAHCPYRKEKHTTTKTVAGKKVKVVQTVDHDPARTDQHKAWLAAADALDKTAGRGVHAPPKPSHS